LGEPLRLRRGLGVADKWRQLDQLAGAQNLAGQRGVVDRLRKRADKVLLEVRVAFERCQLKHLAAQQEHRRELCAEKPQHIAHNGVKYGLGIVC